MGDEDDGGYHLVWPRDAYETASALLAAGAQDEIIRALNFFAVTQEPTGTGRRTCGSTARRYWQTSNSMKSRLPILLLDLARRNGNVGAAELTRLWPMVRNAAGFIVRQGRRPRRIAGKRTPASRRTPSRA